jgi:hypothetical protein
MKIMIGIPTGEFSRRADFYDYYNALDKPTGSVIMASHGQSPAQNRNLIAEQALIHDCTHVLFIDDDMTFEKDTLNKLLVHADKDVVSALYLLRNYPHYPAAFGEGPYDDGKCKFMFLTPDKTGLVEVVNLGLGFCLIKTDVFKKLEKPWVRLGEIEKDEWCDDVGFFNRVRAAGFHLYCDLDIRVGHSLNVTLMPGKVGNEWHSTYITASGQTLNFPQITSLVRASTLVAKTGE